MKEYTTQRNADTPDVFWACQHPPVYTLGRAADEKHVLSPADIPVVNSTRGGQVTYHGPGQLVLYPMIDLARMGIPARALVQSLEQAVIDVLADHGVTADLKEDAPGVYIAGAKVAALGIRVSKGRSYHGLSVNVAMDMSPFQGINPCGYAELAVTQASDHGVPLSMMEWLPALCDRLTLTLGYNCVEWLPEEG